MTSFVTSTTTIAAAAAATTFPWRLTTSHPCWDGLRSRVQRVDIKYLCCIVHCIITVSLRRRQTGAVCR